MKRKELKQLEPRPDSKTNTLTTVQKDNLILCVPEATKKGYAEISPGECVDLTQLSSATRRGRKMDVKSNCLTTSHLYCRYEMNPPKRTIKQLNKTDKDFGNQPRMQDRVYSTDDQSISPSLCESRQPMFLHKTRIRRLTPKECDRLQSIPEWYEWIGEYADGKVKPISDTQHYKMLGNGWQVATIEHIFSFIKPDNPQTSHLFISTKSSEL